jgi:hypothetical protein
LTPLYFCDTQAVVALRFCLASSEKLPGRYVIPLPSLTVLVPCFELSSIGSALVEMSTGPHLLTIPPDQRPSMRSKYR